MEVHFRHGNPTMIQHTVVPAVAAGQVLPLLGAALGGGCLVAHGDIPANTPGSYAIGGGVYALQSDAAIAFGAEVFWNDGTNQGTATGTGNRRFGYAVTAATGVNSEFLAFHVPA